MGREDLLAGGLGDTVRERELEVLGEELLDVWAADVLGLLNLNNLEDLLKRCLISTVGHSISRKRGVIRGWT